MQLWQAVTQCIERTIQEKLKLIKVQMMQGGGINQAYHLQYETHHYFVKVNQSHLLAMFAVEALALQALDATKTLRIPHVITYDVSGDSSFLVLEYVPLKALNSISYTQLGRKLAKIHQQPQSYFGWQQDNYIGHNSQKNKKNKNWLNFWLEQRLKVQLTLAASKGYTGKIQDLGQALAACSIHFFTSQPQASLLHGDLWSGNVAADEQGQAIIYDPACYYGDREADIAMTELFGGFSRDFYAAYEEVWPLDAGYTTRKTFYNLYHILNHLNLFGSGYLSQAESMMQQLIAETKA